MGPAWRATETERDTEIKKKRKWGKGQDYDRGRGRRRKGSVHMKRDTEQDMGEVIGEMLP